MAENTGHCAFILGAFLLTTRSNLGLVQHEYSQSEDQHGHLKFSCSMQGWQIAPGLFLGISGKWLLLKSFALKHLETMMAPGDTAMRSGKRQQRQPPAGLPSITSTAGAAHQCSAGIQSRPGSRAEVTRRARLTTVSRLE